MRVHDKNVKTTIAYYVQDGFEIQFVVNAVLVTNVNCEIHVAEQNAMHM